MIRYGPSGIPLSCKGRTLRDGIEDVHNLGLTALEVQLVRINTNERFATDDDVGRTLATLPGEIVVEIGREGPKKEEKLVGLNVKIQKGDVIRTMASGIARDYIELQELGHLARNLDISMSLHTPYYMDLAGADHLTERSVDSIKWAGLLAQALGAEIIVTHLGLYGLYSKKEALRRITSNLRSLRDWYKKQKLTPKIGIENAGRQEVFGEFDEILSICRSVKGIVPVINFAHKHARESGSMRDKDNFKETLEKTKKFIRGSHHIHFSGVEHEGGNEQRYTPIKKGDLRFEPFAECLMDNFYPVTLISSSPLLEHDAMYMKMIVERVLARKLGKDNQDSKSEKESR